MHKMNKKIWWNNNDNVNNNEKWNNEIKMNNNEIWKYNNNVIIMK